MPSAKHQSLARLLTEGPGVLRAVLAFVGLDVPANLALRPGPDAVRDGGSHDLFPDGTMVAHGGTDQENHEAFVVEVQLGDDDDKPYTWPFYVVVLRKRLRCPTTLVVFCESDEMARWASQPIQIGRGMVMHPLVIGPRQIPTDLSRKQAMQVPALAVLAVVAHGRGPESKRIGAMAFEAIEPLVQRNDPRAILYMDVIHAYLDRPVLDDLLEDRMNLDYQPISPYFIRLFAEEQAKGRAKGRAEGKAEGRAEGRAEAMAQMLARLLDRHGLVPSEEQRERMAACKDPAQLQRWFDRALTAMSTAEIFGG